MEKQLETIDRLDAKIGVLWSLLGAAVIWLLGVLARDQGPRPTNESITLWSIHINGAVWFYVFNLGLFLLVLSFLFALTAIFPRTYWTPANYSDMVGKAGLREEQLKARVLETVVKAYNRNGELILSKSRRLKAALLSASAGVVVVAICLSLLKLLNRPMILLGE